MRFPNGYTTDQPPPDLRADEHFQNWMRTAGLPTFTKLFGRNDNDELIQGRYEITINMSECRTIRSLQVAVSRSICSF